MRSVTKSHYNLRERGRKKKKLPTNGQQEVTTTTNGESLLGERSCKTKKKEGEVKDKTAQDLLCVRACALERGENKSQPWRQRKSDGIRDRMEEELKTSM